MLVAAVVEAFAALATARKPAAEVYFPRTNQVRPLSMVAAASVYHKIPELLLNYVCIPLKVIWTPLGNLT